MNETLNFSYRVAWLAVLACAAACGDDAGNDVCSEFSQPQILPSEQPVCLSFDPTIVGDTATRPVLLQNLGGSDLQISEATLDGNERGHFALQGIDVNTVTCPDAAAAGIVYSPTEPGWDDATLIIESNAQNFPTLRIYFLALAIPDNDPDYMPGPKPEGPDPGGDEPCPDANN